MLHDLSRPKPRNPVTRSPAMRLHTSQLFPENLPRIASNSWIPNSLFGTRAAQLASLSTDIQNLRFRPSIDFTRVVTRILDFWHLLHASVDYSHAPSEELRHLNMTSWMTLDKSHLSPRHVINHVSSVTSSAPCHLADRWPWSTQPDLDHSDLTVDFDLLRWPLTKSQNFWQGLSCLVFHVDSDFGLRFFIWSSKIGQLAHSSFWFLQRHSSRHFQVIFSCLSNLKPLSSFCLEFEGGC